MAPAADLEMDSALWRFVLPFYRGDGIAAACLTLQDRLGVDVNVLLFAIFAQIQRGIALGADDIAAVDALVRDWRAQVVLPLRHVRSRMKSGPAPAPSALTGRLRERIKGAELEAEQIELAVLHDWLERRTPTASSTTGTDVPRMVARWFAGDAAFTPEVEAALGTLLQAMRGAGTALA